VRVAEEGRAVRLRVLSAPDRDGEAASRFFAGGAAEPDTEPISLPPSATFPAVEPAFEPLTGTIVLRFPREQAPPPEALHEALRALARDPRIGAIRFAPWPDRSVRPGRADL
jgi:hypothetical protein